MTAAIDYGATVAAMPGIYKSRRGSEILLVEPESASWYVLAAPEWSLYSRIAALAEPRRLSDIRYDDVLTREAFETLIRHLYYRNLIVLDGKSYYDPARMWPVQRYPHYFNLHVAEGCNLACRYCRVTSRKAAPMMSPETCALIVRRVLEEIPSHSTSFGFHGGEPMLNLKAIAAGVAAGRETHARLDDGRPLKFLMQTNGTMLSPKTVALLKQRNVQTGVSIDGPPALHDSQRVFHNGRGSYSFLQRGLAAADCGGLKLGTLSVVHDPARYVEVLDYLVTALGARSVRINYSMPEGRAKDLLEFPDERGEDFARQWLKMVDYAAAYHAKTGVWLDIADLNLFVFMLLSKQRPHMCYRSPCGIGNSILGFRYDGRIYLCDEVVGNEDFAIGDIHDTTPLAAMLENSPIRCTMMNARRLENLGRCSVCAWRRFHGSGCASKTVAHYGCVDKEDPMCRFYQVVFEDLMWRLWKEPALAGLSGRFARHLQSGDDMPG